LNQGAANLKWRKRRSSVVILLWRFLGLRRLLALFLIRKLWQALRSRPPR
jgi:hypothetical protein